MITKKTTKTEMKRKFYKFLSDNEAITEFNRNFNKPYHKRRRNNWEIPVNKASFFARVEVNRFINAAFLWQLTPETHQFWHLLDSKWNSELRG